VAAWRPARRRAPAWNRGRRAESNQCKGAARARSHGHHGALATGPAARSRKGARACLRRRPSDSGMGEQHSRHHRPRQSRPGTCPAVQGRSVVECSTLTSRAEPGSTGCRSTAAGWPSGSALQKGGVKVRLTAQAAVLHLPRGKPLACVIATAASARTASCHSGVARSRRAGDVGTCWGRRCGVERVLGWSEDGTRVRPRRTSGAQCTEAMCRDQQEWGDVCRLRTPLRMGRSANQHCSYGH